MDKYPKGPEAYLQELRGLIEADRAEGRGRKIISIGEIGLGERSSTLPLFTSPAF